MNAEQAPPTADPMPDHVSPSAWYAAVRRLINVAQRLRKARDVNGNVPPSLSLEMDEATEEIDRLIHPRPNKTGVYALASGTLREVCDVSGSLCVWSHTKDGGWLPVDSLSWRAPVRKVTP